MSTELKKMISVDDVDEDRHDVFNTCFENSHIEINF